MLDIEFRAGWRRNDAEMETDAKAFWQNRKRVLPRNIDPDKRAHELCAIAYRDGEAVGVSTAVIQYIEQFRSNMAVYRCAVATEFGHQPLSWRITNYSRVVLERWSLENPAEKVMGLMAIMQSKTLVTRYPDVFGVVDMTFTGFAPSGFPVRVAWFTHATIPTEWPPRPAADQAPERGIMGGMRFPIRIKGW